MVLVASLLAVASPVAADSVDAAVAAARGGALPVRTELENAAAAAARRQVGADRLRHSDLSSLSAVCSRAGEVLGAGGDVSSVFQAFRNSPAHWSIITNPAWTAAGTATAQGDDGVLYVAVVFCVEHQPSGGAAPAPPPPPAPVPAAPVHRQPVPAETSDDPPDVVFGPNLFIPLPEWPASQEPTVS